jgi:hypothetical protein
MNIKTKVPIKDPAMMSEMCELCVERGETSDRIQKYLPSEGNVKHEREKAVTMDRR